MREKYVWKECENISLFNLSYPKDRKSTHFLNLLLQFRNIPRDIIHKFLKPRVYYTQLLPQRQHKPITEPNLSFVKLLHVLKL